jgi:hypothetical protein
MSRFYLILEVNRVFLLHSVTSTFFLSF